MARCSSWAQLENTKNKSWSEISKDRRPKSEQKTTFSNWISILIHEVLKILQILKRCSFTSLCNVTFGGSLVQKILQIVKRFMVSRVFAASFFGGSLVFTKISNNRLDLFLFYFQAE